MSTKICDGPSHAKPVELPLTQEYWNFRSPDAKYSAGLPYAKCKQCRLYARTGKVGGLVPLDKVHPLVQELVLRCGNVEQASQYLDISDTALRYIVDKKVEHVRKDTVRKVVLALYQRRKEDRRNGSSERFRKALLHQAAVRQRLDRLTGY